VFWTEEEAKPNDESTHSIVDLVFTVSARTFPVDHAHALSEAMLAILPWMEAESGVGIHQIHVAESGNGWERPDGDLLFLSRRTKFTMRLPKERVKDAESLIGKTISVDGHELQFAKSAVKQFSVLPTLFSRYVLGLANESENDFLHRCAAELKEMGIPVRKMLAGKTHSFSLPEGECLTRTLMIADLSSEHAILLQQRGLGEGRLNGFGLFIPHKGITAVTDEDGKNQSMD